MKNPTVVAAVSDACASDTKKAVKKVMTATAILTIAGVVCCPMRRQQEKNMLTTTMSTKSVLFLFALVAVTQAFPHISEYEINFLYTVCFRTFYYGDFSPSYSCVRDRLSER